MSVPDYQTLTLPVLESLADGATRSTYPEITDHIVRHFGLTQDELDERFTSGQPAFYNRTQWAVTYLSKAGAIDRVGRGKVAITQRGKEILAGKPDRVDVDYLRQFPEFEEFRTKTRVRNTPSAALTPLDPDANPEELLYGTYESLRQAVEVDILDRLQSESLSWAFFEQLVVRLWLGRIGRGLRDRDNGEGRHRVVPGLVPEAEHQAAVAVQTPR